MPRPRSNGTHQVKQTSSWRGEELILRLNRSEGEEEVVSLPRHTCPFSFPAFVSLGSGFMADVSSYQRSSAPSNFLPRTPPPLPLNAIPERPLKTRRRHREAGLANRHCVGLLGELRAWYSLDVTGRHKPGSVRARPQSPHLCPPRPGRRALLAGATGRAGPSPAEEGFTHRKGDRARAKPKRA